MFPWYLIFLKRSLVSPILLFSSISLHWSLRKAFSLSLLFLINLFGCASLSCIMWVLNGSMWDPVPQPGIKPIRSALGAWSLSHWTTREVLGRLSYLSLLWPRFNIKKTKIMASGAITSWKVMKGRKWKQWQTLFWGAPKSLQMKTTAWN